ncbi:MAG: metal-dependent transcriptional regulator [Zhaonellaceae bacterium]|jgi:DtxR family Mn-dependent transcriptional regulator|nr:metal-dependent transcriptional regulator [Clostridia bacterium]
MKILEAGENYLETIYILSKRNKTVRSIDIANEMNYSKPTISVAMKQFRENGYIKMDDNGYITLTDKGLEIALRIYERHQIIAEFLMAIGVDEETAFDDSCKMEHHISQKSFECLKSFYLNNKEKIASQHN